MAVDISRVRLLCFDVDGTLRDTDDQLVQRISNRLRLVRWILPGGDPRPLARRIVMAIEEPGNYFQALSDRLGIDPYTARLTEYLTRTRAEQCEGDHLLVRGVREALERFKSEYSMAIVSSRSELTTHTFLEQCELSNYFYVVVTGQTCKYTKPYPDPILWAARKTGVSPSECLMIGDTTLDIRAGKRAGAQTVGVLSGFGEEDELLRAGADMILPGISELADYLLKA